MVSDFYSDLLWTFSTWTLQSRCIQMTEIFSTRRNEFFPHPGLWHAALLPRCGFPAAEWTCRVPAVHCSPAAELLLSAQDTDRYWNHLEELHSIWPLTSAGYIYIVSLFRKKWVNARKKNFNHFSYESPLPRGTFQIFGDFLCAILGTNTKIIIEKCDNFNCRLWKISW